MSVLPIRLFPDPILRKPSKPARWHEPRLERFFKDLIETLRAQPGGIGIAAPQVGEGVRAIVVDVSPRDPSKRMELMINPILCRLEGEILSREGCMSLPDYTANVVRAERVWVEWVDLKGRKHRKATSGIEAICLQHEIDHLNGFLFIDRVMSLKTDVFPRPKKPDRRIP